MSISGFDSVGLTDPFYYGKADRLLRFTSPDHGNDLVPGNCALSHGGWWYRGCSAVLLNKDYQARITILLNGQWHALPFVEMKIRPLNCSKSFLHKLDSGHFVNDKR